MASYGGEYPPYFKILCTETDMGTFKSNQNHIASGGYDKIVRLFDVESGTVLKTFTGHSLSISSTMFNPLGNLIVSG